MVQTPCKQRVRENIAGTEDARGRLHYLEWCLDDVKASELKEGKRKASPKCGFASYDRYATVSRSGSRYTLATRRCTGHTQNASRKFIRSQPPPLSPSPSPAKRKTRSIFFPALFTSGSVGTRESRRGARNRGRTRAEIISIERFSHPLRLMTCFRSRRISHG